MAKRPDADRTPLSAATVQQIQFELFRRSAVSIEYGHLVEPLIDVLRAHPDLWTGMVIVRVHIGHRGHGLLPMERFGCMIDVYDDPAQLDSALGGADDGVAILRARWD